MGFFRSKKSKDVAGEETATSVPLDSHQNQVAGDHGSNRRNPQQAVELGTIRYVNLTPDGRHGDMDVALRVAAETGKPLFCNFVEWSG